MKAYSGIDYLKIDVANNFGLDKKQFEERIDWFNKTIEPRVNKTSSNDDLLQIANESDEAPALVFGGLQAYRDTLNGIPSGYKIGLDACCSGIQILSALTACKSGLTSTGLIGNKRNDAYTLVYEEFKRLYGKPNNKTRDNCKDSIMPMYYGSNKRPKDYFGHTDEELQCFYQANKNICTGAFSLRNLWCDSWNPEVTRHTFSLPDAFDVVLPNLVQNTYLAQIDGHDIEFKVKEEGTSKHSVSNCANSTHALDGMICREMQRRANFDKGHFEYLLYLLNTITDQMDEEAKDAISVEEMDKLGVFGDLLYYYETTGFFTIRIADEIKDISMLLKLSQKHRNKLSEVLHKLYAQGCFELVTVHDCFYTKANYCNYTRYWYKELLADLCQSTVLEFITEQLVPNNHQLHIPQSQRNKVAKLIRESEYGIC